MPSTLGRLLLQWEEALEQGRELPLEQLAQGDPGLLEALREAVALVKRQKDTVADGKQGGPPRQGTITVAPPAPLTGRGLTTAAEEATHSPPPSDAPERIGRFEVRRFLGEGGFGRVYEAYDPSLKRPVALKVAKQGDDQRRVERFLREARAAAVLTHPNIVAVFDSGVDGARYYIASAFVPGEPLSDVIHLGAMQAPQAAEVARKLAEALAYAHKQGVIHRDVKPANVMLREDGEPLLMDFGLAARSDEDSKLTIAGQFMGTPAYAAPEQWRGEATAHSDQYSLGCLLFELLTGQTPFTGAGPGHYLVLHTQYPVPDMPGVPRDLETITRKCLEKEAHRRYADCQELADDLGRFLKGEPTRARPVGPLEKLWRWARREPLMASLVATVALLLLAGTAVAWWLAAWANWEAGEKDREARAARLAEKQARENEALARRREETANFEAFRAADAKHAMQMDLALRSWEGHDLARAEQILADVDARFRDAWETRHVRGLCWRKARTVRHAVSVLCARFSPDGTRVVGGCVDHTARVWDVRTGKQLLSLAGHTEPVGRACYSADGGRILTASWDGSLKLWNATSGREELTIKGQTAVFGACFSPDGKRLLSGGRGGLVRMWGAHTGRELLLFKGHTQDVTSVAFSPDGKLALSGCQDATLKLWDSQTGNEKFTLKGHNGGLHGVCFSPDGKRILSGSFDRTLKVWDARTGRELLTLPGHAYGANDACFSPDGKSIMSGGSDHAIRLWDAQTGREKLVLRAHALGVNSVCFSPDGKLILSSGGDKTLRLWDTRARQDLLTVKCAVPVCGVAFSPDGKFVLLGRRRQLGSAAPSRVVVCGARTGREKLVLDGLPGWIHSVCYSPDGKLILAGSGGPPIELGHVGHAKVWDARTGKELHYLRGHRDAVLCVAFSPDGERALTGSADSTLKVWGARTGRELLTLRGHRHDVRCAAFSPDGKFIASGSGVALNPTQEGRVKVWDAHTGQCLRTLEGHEGWVNAVCFSPDGKSILSGSSDRTLRVWDAATGKTEYTLRGHADAVHSACYSPDGKRIVSGGADNTLRLWDARTGQEKLVLRGHTGEVNSVCFSRDGELIASGGEDGAVKLWGALPPAPR